MKRGAVDMRIFGSSSTLLYGHLCHSTGNCASPKACSTFKDIVSISREYSRRPTLKNHVWNILISISLGEGIYLWSISLLLHAIGGNSVHLPLPRGNMAAVPVHLPMAALLQLPDHLAQSCQDEKLSTEVADSIWFLCHVTSDSANAKAPSGDDR